jgi:hypothetical protein
MGLVAAVTAIAVAAVVVGLDRSMVPPVERVERGGMLTLGYSFHPDKQKARSTELVDRAFCLQTNYCTTGTST